MASGQGAFCWYELMTTDMDAAERFYRDVVGWTARAAGHDGMAYKVLHAGEAPAAGLMTLPEEARAKGARPSWIGYIAVDDVDAYAQRVTAAGGRLHRPPADIPGVGRFAVVGDPQGVSFVLFKDLGEAAVPPARSGVGSVGWRELVADDGAAAFAFYSEMFGWTKAGEVDMGAMGIYQLFASGGDATGGMMTRPPSVPAPFWNFYIEVDSVGAAIERLKTGGGTVINGPHQVPGGAWIVQGIDPQGALFALTSGQA